MINKFYKALNCISDDNRHKLGESDDEKAWAECVYCGERFYLISKTVLDNGGIEVQEREF